MLPGMSAGGMKATESEGGGETPTGSFGYCGFATSSDTTSGYALDDVPIGSANADRLVAVSIHWAEGSAHNLLSSVTIGGVAATIAVQTGHSGGSTGFGVAVAYAEVPSGSTADVVANFAGTCNGCTAHAFRYVGLSSSTPNDTDSDQTAGTADDMSCSVDVLADGLVHVAYSGSDFAGSGTIGGATTRYEAPGGVGAMSSGLSAQTGKSVTWNTSPANNAGNGMVVVAWA